MNQLQIIKQNGQLLVDSRQVAEMVGKEHGHLLRDIKGYLEVLGKSNFGLADFFIEDAYIDSQGKARPRYLITRKGCDMVANKMTGEKGVLFTATYVSKFEEMEQQIKNELDISKLSPELQMFKAIFDAQAKSQLELLEARKELSEVKTTIEVIQETFLQRDEDWRKSVNHLLNKASFQSGGNYRDLRNKSYELLEDRAHCDLNKRLRNLVERLERTGATKTQLRNTTKMDVIESDPRLKEIYTTIVKELSIGSLKVAGR